MERSADDATSLAGRFDIGTPCGRWIGDDLAIYTMLSRAIADRPVRVTSGGAARTYTDTEVIYVGDSDLVHARDAALIQSALIWAGSLEAPIMQRLLGRPSAARRYLAVEAPRALYAIARKLPGAKPERLADLGYKADVHNPTQSLKLALGRSEIQEPPDVYGVVRPRCVLAARPLSLSGATGAGGGSLEMEDDDTEELEEDEETLRLGFIGKLVNGGAAGFSVSARALKALGLGREPGAGESAPGDMGHFRPGRGPSVNDPAFSLHPEPISMDLIVAGIDDVMSIAGWAYPEWDFRQQRYREGWCTVVEVDPEPREAEICLNIADASALRRNLATIGLVRQRHRHELNGDELELDAVIQSRVDLVAGHTPDERLYVDTRKTQRDLGVLLLLDVSGSSADSSLLTNNHAQQISAAAALADAWVALGARVAVYGFRSQGRNSVHLLRVKTFDDLMDSRARQRLVALAPRGFTRLGPAIRHARHILQTEAGTANMLLMVLSDGFAYDAGYEGPYAAADSRRGLEEARDGGIGSLCLTLGSDTPERTLDDVFGSAVRATGDRMEVIAPKLGKLCRAALASADLRRRFDRREDEGQ
ncbi:VWA domain-containing protein [Mycobacterium sp. CVI_P3]|uniref:VWA domain-containing protein n=1 Tax=Mycobacterium pinniadriaticum TaxID=2994102 RepID=A0ABT3SF16_9MYCO|nr:VWA domain-containing protein [Mycobacterium pinniadriaticum]MCX2931819.1 VWA domain-containing protein [Mycobacterium pinniadriaticum]MCX2938106.1 VWA domain-containing protein [Mycobacterium pinniadriaticum]